MERKTGFTRLRQKKKIHRLKIVRTFRDHFLVESREMITSVIRPVPGVVSTGVSRESSPPSVHLVIRFVHPLSTIVRCLEL